ncbi:MAG: MarR family transcriptional regulator [Firmicutes bacterium]|nr:MarR family transcriptional regulator [Bacillota bacterium]
MQRNALHDELHFLVYLYFQKSNGEICKEVTSRLGLLPGQPKILEFLGVEDGARPVEIATACDLDRSTVSGLLCRMEDMGLVEKRSCEHDARSFYVFLTERGRDTLRKVKEICLSVDERAMKGLSPEERTFILDGMNKMLDNLS